MIRLTLILMMAACAYADDYVNALSSWLHVAPIVPRVQWLADKSALTALNKPGYGAANSWMYESTSDTIYAYPVRVPAPLMRHEIFHAMSHARLAWLPVWLEEGAATMMETAHVTDDGSLRFITSNRLRAAWRYDVTLLQVQAFTNDDFAGNRNDIAYCGAYAVAVWMRTTGTLQPWLHGQRSDLDPVAFRAWLSDPWNWP